MIIRAAEEKDIEIIESLNKMQPDFKLDNLNGRVIDRLVFDGTVPVAYGIVKRHGEAIILVNPKSPLLLRAKAMRELMQYAEVGAKIDGCGQIHCFVHDDKLARTLERQFGFVRTTDIVMVKNL